MRIKTLMLAAVIFLSLAAVAQAQTARNDVEKTIDRILQEFYDRHQYRGGISLAITRNEKLVYAGAVGYADRNHTVRLTPQHRMRLASVSKPITSIAISKLFEEGRLSLDGNVFGTNGIFKNKYGMPTYNGNSVDVTVRQLLEHRSGFHGSYRNPLASGETSPWNSAIEPGLETPLMYMPGTAYEYSGFGYNVLGWIIEELTGMPYEKYIQDYILKPCGINGMRVGMRQSGPDEAEYIGDNLSENPPINAPGPSGGWIASSIDLMKFMVHIDNFSNVPDILKSNTPRINIFGHSGRLNQGTWTFLQRTNNYNWVMLMNYVPPNFEEIDRNALFRQITDAVSEWPAGTELSGISSGDTFGGRTPYNDFYFGILSYRSAAGNIEVVVNEDFTLNQLVSIEAPWTAGVTLTIRSANPARPVTITRGVSGNLFTIANGATLIMRDIIIDGGKDGAFANSGGGTLVWANSGTFIMNAGAILRNNINTTTSHPGGGVFTYGSGTFTINGGVITGNSAVSNGGGVYIYGTGSFTMNGGEISGNTAGANGGGVIAASTFTMNGGQISGNTAGNTGGGVYNTAPFTMTGGKITGNTSASTGGGVITTNAFTMSGGEISGNSASGGNGVRVSGGSAVFNLNGGVVAGTGTNIAAIISGTYNLNTASPNNAVIIAWNRPSGTLNYIVGTNTNLTVSAGGTASWANQNGTLGISYANGANRGWIRAW